MTEKQDNVQFVMDMFGGNVVLEKEEDKDGIDFSVPIKGKYVCRIVALERKAGKSEKTGNDYDFFALKMQAEEDVSGDPSFSRMLDKTYFIGTSEYEDDPDAGVKRLFNDLFTADILQSVNITCKDRYEAIAEIAPQIVDKLVNVSAYKTKNGKQAVRIVDAFKLKEAKKKEEDESLIVWDE